MHSPPSHSTVLLVNCLCHASSFITHQPPHPIAVIFRSVFQRCCIPSLSQHPQHPQSPCVSIGTTAALWSTPHFCYFHALFLLYEDIFSPSLMEPSFWDSLFVSYFFVQRSFPPFPFSLSIPPQTRVIFPHANYSVPWRNGFVLSYYTCNASSLYDGDTSLQQRLFHMSSVCLVRRVSLQWRETQRLQSHYPLKRWSYTTNAFEDKTNKNKSPSVYLNLERNKSIPPHYRSYLSCIHVSTCALSIPLANSALYFLLFHVLFRTTFGLVMHLFLSCGACDVSCARIRYLE